MKERPKFFRTTEPEVMDLTIIIIHYHTREILSRCIESIHYTGNYEIIIVDNENDPEFMEEMKKRSKVRVIAYQGNLGFSKANNVGIQQSNSRYIFTLNADVFLTSGYIEQCISFLEDHDQYSSIQGKLLLERTPNLIDSAGNALAKVRLAYNRFHGDSDRNIPSGDVFGVCAAAAIYRRTSLEAVRWQNEYYDNDFFAYLEDVDLDWRLRLKGFRAYFLNTATALHIREVSTQNSYRLTQALRNRLFLILKNDNSSQVAFNLILAPVMMLCTPHPIANLKLLPTMLKKRQHIQAHKKVSTKVVSHEFSSNPWGLWIKKLLKTSQ